MAIYDEGGSVIDCSGLDAGFAPGEFEREYRLTFDQQPDYAMRYLTRYKLTAITRVNNLSSTEVAYLT